MKYTTCQLEKLENQGVEIMLKDIPVLKKKYLDNHIHDYSDPDAIEFNVEKDCYDDVCCWCSKKKWSRKTNE